MAETYPGFQVMAFNALVTPAGVPQPVLEKLSADIRAVVSSDAFREKTKHLGINAYGNTPAELSAWMRTEIARWQEVAKAANLKAELTGMTATRRDRLRRPSDRAGQQGAAAVSRNVLARLDRWSAASLRWNRSAIR